MKDRTSASPLVEGWGEGKRINELIEIIMGTEFHKGASSELFGNAKKLRRNRTEAENILWENIRHKKLNGLKFRRQHPIGDYIIDFYCHDKKLGIEVDGEIHQKKEHKMNDLQRTSELNQLGIQIIRFTNNEILDEMKMVKKKILDSIKFKLPQP
jgi:cyclase